MTSFFLFHILIAQLKRTRCPSGNFRNSTGQDAHTGALYTCTLTSLDTADPFPISKSFQEETKGVSPVYVMSQWHFAEMIVLWDLHIWNSLQGGLWKLQPNLLSGFHGVILFQEPAASDGSGKMQRSAKGSQPCRTQWGLKATHKNETSPWSYWKSRSDLRKKLDFWGENTIELTQNQKPSMPSDEKQAKAL